MVDAFGQRSPHDATRDDGHPRRGAVDDEAVVKEARCRPAAGVSSDEPKGKRPAGGALEWRGPCCGGTMVWGKGNGYKPARGGDREYRCGNSGCRKLLPKPSTQDILDDLALDKAIREAECLAAALL